MDAKLVVRGIENTSAAFTTAARVICARADIAYAHASLLRVHAKGTLGEIMAERAFLRNKLGEQISGKWTSLTPRTGRQGFDHLFVRKDGNKFKWMVCESKYGTSQLGTTKGGVRQMSWVWMHERAVKLGDAYLKIADRKVTFRKVPWFKSGVKTYDIPLDNGTKATFWRDKNGHWHFDGPKDQLAKAREMAKKMGLDLKSPTCNIRGRKFHITAEGNDLKITLEDIKSGVGSKDIETISTQKEIILKDVLGKNISDEELKKQIAEELRKKFPNLTKAEIKELAEELAEKKTNGSLLKEAMSTFGSIVLQSSMAGGIAAVFDTGIQLILTRKIDLQRVALTAGAATTGAAMGQVASIIFIKTKSGATAVRFMYKAFHLRSASLMRNSLAGGLGAIATSAVTAYGGVWLGHCSWDDANKEFASGAAGTVGGAVVVSGTTGAIATWGTASTGTAISTLSGAAQTKAILAWIGRFVGGGVKAGTFTLGIVGIVAGFAISAAVSATISAISSANDRKYQLLKNRLYSRTGVWDTVARRMIKDAV